MIDEEKLSLERQELAEVNQRGAFERFSCYARRSGPGWFKLTVEEDLTEKTLRDTIVRGLIESYQSTNRTELADKYSAELSE